GWTATLWLPRPPVTRRSTTATSTSCGFCRWPPWSGPSSPPA
ncbi:uncharacterized protein METZ01_LOCUS417683, partial [marine metagenome]